MVEHSLATMTEEDGILTGRFSDAPRARSLKVPVTEKADLIGYFEDLHNEWNSFREMMEDDKD
jgi:hypothetical protein